MTNSNMRYDLLGNTDLKVSKICLGTMTWGEQNIEEDAHQQMSYALDRGINFLTLLNCILFLSKQKLRVLQKNTWAPGLKRPGIVIK